MPIKLVILLSNSSCSLSVRLQKVCLRLETFFRIDWITDLIDSNQFCNGRRKILKLFYEFLRNTRVSWFSILQSWVLSSSVFHRTVQHGIVSVSVSYLDYVSNDFISRSFLYLTDTCFTFTVVATVFRVLFI